MYSAQVGLYSLCPPTDIQTCNCDQVPTLLHVRAVLANASWSLACSLFVFSTVAFERAVATAVGSLVGLCVSGTSVGALLAGMGVSCAVGASLAGMGVSGVSVGAWLHRLVGPSVGASLGGFVGVLVGCNEGLNEGVLVVGTGVVTLVGNWVGSAVGTCTCQSAWIGIMNAAGKEALPLKRTDLHPWCHCCG